jgi:uncharacterized protein YkwD
MYTPRKPWSIFFMKACPIITNPISGLMNFFEKRSSIAHIFLAFVMIFPSGISLSQSTPPQPDPSLDTPAQMLYSEALDYSGCGGQAPAAVNSAYEQQVVELVNLERTSRGLPPLKHVASLDQAARYHATDMQQDNYFDHDTYDRVNGVLSLTCSMATRISGYYPNWNWIGENIALGYSSPQNVMAGWMGSPGHQQNILQPEFWEIGVGYYTGGYWVQDFGRRNNVYPLVINNEAAETNNKAVSLYIYNRSATYGWSEMRLKNDALTWTPWMPYQSTFAWNLPNSTGDHTVTVELRRGTITASSSDNIYLTQVDAGELGNLPQNLTFTYSIADHRFIPDDFDLVPLNVGGTSSLNWSINKSGAWFNVTPGAGSSPGGFSVIPTGSYTVPGTTFVGSLTVIITSPDGVEGSPHQIALSLRVIADSFEVYLPVLTRTP